MKRVIIVMLAIILLCFSGHAATIIDEAMLHLDKPYRYGREGPNSFDCSGFVYYCFLQQGTEIQRVAKDQGYDDTYLKIDNIDNLMPGDAVYFNTVRDKDKCDHAGIYIGNGDFIHCSSGQRKVVISSLLKGYYNRRFSWGRRVIEVK